MNNKPFQVGDRVRYTGLSQAEVGTITDIHLEAVSTSPTEVEVQAYDIALDNGGNLIRVREHVEHLND